MEAYYPDGLVVLLNIRSSLSLLGIVAIVLSTWLWERKWDEEGAENSITARPSTSTKDVVGYKDMEEGSGEIAEGTEEVTEGQSLRVLSEIIVKDLKETVTFPTETSSHVQPWIKPALAGWFVVALSYIFPRSSWFGFDFSFLALASMILICCLGYVQAVVIPKLIVRKDFTHRKDLWNMVMASGLFLQGIFAFLLDSNAPVFAAPLGGLCVALSPMVMWTSRLLGDTFDSEGRPNPNPTLFNFGGPLLVFGWFWFWIGMNVSYVSPGDWMPYIHFYSGTRMLVAFLGAMFALCANWLVGYAFDGVVNMSGKPDTPEILAEASAFGCCGYFCGYSYETKVATIMSWFFFGLAMFFPFIWGDHSDWFFLVAAVSMGYSVAMINEDGLRDISAEKTTLWCRRSWFCLFVMAIIIPIQQGGHYMSIILSGLGAMLYALGFSFLLQDQRRGWKWVETTQVQQPKIYSYGALLTPLGLLVLAWAVSMHPN